MHLTDCTPWIRVFYRNGKSDAYREGSDLDRAIARKVPVIIHIEPALIHRCQRCEKEEAWGPGWISYPVLKHHPPHIQAKTKGAEFYKACSPDCWALICEKAFDIPKWADTNREPDRGAERNRPLYDAIRDEQDRKRGTVAHRKVPLPVWRGAGFCKWCNLPMTAADKPSWLWHKECSRQFMLHSDLWTQTRYLRERDGRACAMPGCDRHGSEVDHRRPLWSVRHLADMIRRAFYGPINLWLLCNECHAAKTKREAGERAALRASGNDLEAGAG